MSTLKRITWEKREDQVPPAPTCGECSYLTKSVEYLTVKERRPILGSCPFSKYLRLLSDKICEHFNINVIGNIYENKELLEDER